MTPTPGIWFRKRRHDATLRSFRFVTAARALLAVAVAGAAFASAPAPAAASAVCPSPGTLADIIAVDATFAGTLTVQFRPIYGVYAEGAAGCWSGKEIALSGYVSSPEGLGGISTFTIEPAWLVSRAHFLSVTDAVDADSGPVGPFLPVAVPVDLKATFASLKGRWVRVSGHFGDPIAETCVVKEADPDLGPCQRPSRRSRSAGRPSSSPPSNHWQRHPP